MVDYYMCINTYIYIYPQSGNTQEHIYIYGFVMIKDDRLQVPQAGLVEATWEDRTAAMGPSIAIGFFQIASVMTSGFMECRATTGLH